MFTAFKKLSQTDPFLLLSFIAGCLPAVFIIQIIPVDFSGFYFEALSFLKFKSYAYQIISNYCDNPLNSGLNARAPLVPLLLAISIGLFNRTLLGIYLPFFLIRLILFPLFYVTAKQYVPRMWAITATVLLLLVPRLQTYAFGTFEADIFVGIFYLAAIYCYGKSKRLQKSTWSVLFGISLGLAALTKSIGLGIAIGFFLAAGLVQIHKLRHKIVRNNLIAAVAWFLVLIGPYVIWTVTVHHQLYITTQHDRSLSYIPANLPSLIATIPVYLGLQFSSGIKALAISGIFLFCLLSGIVIAFKTKLYELILPVIVTLVLIAMLETCVIGGAIVANFEFISILGFTLFPTIIVLLIGVKEILNIFWKKLFFIPAPRHIQLLIIFFLLYKFCNNYFAQRLALDFIPDEYYLTLPTVLTNTSIIHDVTFEMQNGLRIFTGPVSHKIIRQQFIAYKSDPFSQQYKNAILILLFINICLLLLDRQKQR